ncbi:hypothetical protein BHM03_00049184 [Ensete ventricosum]|nr:hypothetical protein BHM03_00049184 [Ensete ventricosum]
MNRADKSAGLHFVSTLIDRVHDVGRLVRSQHEKILVLRAANKELKSQAGQDLAVATELHMKELEEDVDKLQVELGLVSDNSGDAIWSLPPRCEFSMGAPGVTNLGLPEDQVSCTNELGSDPPIVESGDCPLVM